MPSLSATENQSECVVYVIVAFKFYEAVDVRLRVRDTSECEVAGKPTTSSKTQFIFTDLHSAMNLRQYVTNANVVGSNALVLSQV
jgi:hypothetical protein